MHRHIIVSGDDALATTLADELKNAGATVVRLTTAEKSEAGVARELTLADVSHALAVVCAGDDDAINLEIALLARKANPNVRVVSRVANDVLREAVADDNGPGAILDVADLAAPAVVEACLSQTIHDFDAAGMNFVVAGKTASREATLRELYGDLAPVAVIHGEDSLDPGGLDICPGRDQRVHAGDWTMMIGTADELAAQGIRIPRGPRPRSQRPLLRRVVDGVRGVINDFNPTFYPVVAATLVVLVSATITLRFGYRPPPKMGWVDAFYFTIETMTTTGYGDFSFVNQPTWLRTFSTLLMFSGVTTTALLVSFVADVLLSRRFVFASARPRVGHLRNHIVVVGLSGLGMRVVSDLTAAGYDVAVIERNEENRFLSAVRDLDVPVIFGDATLRQTLQAARVDRARAVAVLTRDDIINIETGIVLAEMLGKKTATREHWTDIPLVLRVYDRALGFAVAQRFGFENVRSTVELAAPWFIGAAIGLQVLGTFSVGQSSFVVGGMQVAAGSELDGLRMFEMSTQARVIAITTSNGLVKLHPRRDARLHADDTVYLVGPYRELIDTLRKGRPPRPTGTDDKREAKTG
ncbi:NAD-binding protein [Mycobacterium sp.]|uniref:NAD-binding protein n=1 Tax=Mycobacterium sp. TaxID=1785 RepID=UPI003BAE9CD0